MVSIYKTLPNIAEDCLVNYISGKFTGTYPKVIPDSTAAISGAYSFHRGFSVEPLTFPAIIVTVGKLKEQEPGMHVYKGQVNVSVFTQADDTANPVGVHDAAAAQVYSILSTSDSLFSGLNSGASNLRVFGFINTHFDQSIGHNGEGSRLLMTLFDYEIEAQALPTFAPVP